MWKRRVATVCQGTRCGQDYAVFFGLEAARRSAFLEPFVLG
jgi:hypothetical protein